MPQLSLYIDQETLDLLKTAADMESVSLSKYAGKALKEALSRGWPENFDQLYGVVTDESFSYSDSGSVSDGLQRGY